MVYGWGRGLSAIGWYSRDEIAMSARSRPSIIRARFNRCSGRYARALSPILIRSLARSFRRLLNRAFVKYARARFSPRRLISARSRRAMIDERETICRNSPQSAFCG